MLALAAMVCPEVGAARVPPLLASVEAELKAAAGCDSFRVVWSGALEKELARLVQASAAIDRGAGPGAAPGGAAPPARSLIRVRGVRDGRPIECTLFASAECFGAFYLAPRALGSGAVISRDELVLTTGWHAPDALTPDDRLPAWLFAPRGVSPGRAIAPDQLVAAPLVRRATPIAIRYAGPGLVLTGRGLARADGWLGDRLKVRLDGSLRDCEGQVTAPGEVTVGPLNEASPLAPTEGSTR